MTDTNRRSPTPVRSRHLLRRAFTLCLLIAAAGLTLLPFRGALASAHEALPALAVGFEENRGQFGPEARFGVRSAGFAVTFDDHGALLGARRADGRPWPLRLTPHDAAAAPAPIADRALAGRVNYYRGNDPSNWYLGIRRFERVRYASVYPGIDLVYRGYGDRVEYDFVVAPGADPGLAGMRVDGAERLSVDTDGGLVAHAGDDRFHFAAPYVYQDGEDGRETVAGAFRLRGDNVIAFELGDFDPTRALVIDPVILGYSTRLGGSGMDEPREIAIDDSGFIYVAGGTESTDFSGAGGPASGKDVFVSKITPDGQALVYTTLLSGSGNGTEDAVGLAADALGHAYVAGQTESVTFPTVNGASSTRGGDADYFIARLDPRGLIAYSSLYGGDGRDGEFDGGLALAGGNIAWITGRTASLPPGGLPDVNAYEDDCAFATCAFAAAFDTRLAGPASLVYSSYIGGDSDEGGKSIAVDADDNVYVFGFTGSDADLIAPAQGFQPLSADVNNNDTFLIKLDPRLAGAAQRVYSTYMSGPDDESEDGQVVTGANGIVWVVGATSSVAGPLVTDFPNKNAMQTQNAGSQDAFVMKIDTTLSGDASLLFATFVGASGNEGATSLALDQGENIYLAMSTSSFDFPVVAPLEEFLPFSPPDPMLVHLDAAAMTIETSTPVPGVDRLVVDAVGDILIAGRSQQATFPLVSPLPPSPVGSSEIFLGKVRGRPLSGITLEIEDVGDPVAVGETFAFRYTLTNSGDDDIDGLTLTSDLPTATLDPLPAVCFNTPGGMECTPNDLSTTPLAPGENLTWFVRGSAATAGSVAVTTTNVTTLPADPDTSDNSATETIDIDASGSTPTGTLRLSDFDATGLAFDIGGFMIDTPQGVLSSPGGSLDEAASFMVFDGSIPLHVRGIWSQGKVAFGLVERNDWTPAPFDGASLFAQFDTPSDRVYAEVDDKGRVTLYSAQAFSPGVVIAEGFVGLDPDKAFSIDLTGTTASVFYDGELIVQANPFQGGGATQGQVGDDFVISIGGGNEFLGAALIDRRAPGGASGSGGLPPVNPQVCSQSGFNPAPRRDPAAFGWTTFNTGAVDVDWSTSDDTELCGAGAVPTGNLTGGSGDAACIDSDTVGPGLVDSYLCSPAIDLTSAVDPDLQFRLAYQIADPQSGEDALEVLVGSAVPGPATIATYDLLKSYSANVGSFGDSGIVEALQLIPGESVHVCFRYAADYDWYAQVDDVTVSADNCSGPAWADSDEDGVSDEFDNCTTVPNPAQQDSDGDGIGNQCDADFNDDCVVNVIDLGVMKQNFFSAGDVETDLNGDGITNAIDLGLLKTRFFGTPGPSGVAASCAATFCEGGYIASSGGSVFSEGDASVIGFVGLETCPATTTLGDGSDWDLIPDVCNCN